MKTIFNEYYKEQYFEFFDELGQFYKKNSYPQHGYQLESLFQYLHNFLLSKGVDLFSALRSDYYGNFRIRPNGFWCETMDKQKRKQLLYIIGQDKDFLRKYNLTRKIVEKQTMIDELSGNEYLLTIFMEDGRKEYRYRLIE